MKKNIMAMVMALAVFVGLGTNVHADNNAMVSFTESNTLEYSGAAMANGEVNLGAAFENVVPGELRTQIITLKNENGKTADFYMSAEVVEALETNTVAARGAGYDIELKVGNTVLYDSTVGGYSASEAASASGIGGMNSVLEDYILVATLNPGESREIALSIKFDGEAMDNTSAIDYSLTDGKLAFDFMVGYDEPAKETIVRYEQKEEVIRIIEVVKTGDEALIGVAIAVLAAGLVLLVLGRKKKTEEEA